MRHALILLALAGLPLAAAQTSTSFTLEEHAFTAGGHPGQGVVMASSGFRISLDAIGEGIVRSDLASASFRLDASFAGCYPAPGEVLDLQFLDEQNLRWAPEKSIGVYNLYRDALSSLAGLGYGACAQQDLASPEAVDSTPPPPADGFFYLVTAENRLGEEGTRGFDGSGAEREGTSACP